jgi:ribosomal protein L40E
MDPDINPVMRVIGIILVCTIPIAVVILQRLDAVKLIIRDIKEGKFSLSFDDLLSPNNANISICPKCHSANPPNHKFCGYCGAPLPPHPKDEEIHPK